MAVRVLVPAGALPLDEVDLRRFDLTGDAYHYAIRVRRQIIGDRVELYDGTGVTATATITAIDAERAIVDLGAVRRAVAPLPWITALVPLIKGERMDDCVEKLVEAGVSAIVLWDAARAVVKLDGERAAARLRRFIALIEAAARQSGRADTPTIFGPVLLAAALASVPGDALRLTLHPSGEAIAQVLDAPGWLASWRASWRTGHGEAPPDQVVLLSGPEGGLSDDELRRADAAGFARIGLGRRVLRAETAPVVATALLRALTDS